MKKLGRHVRTLAIAMVSGLAGGLVGGVIIGTVIDLAGL